MSVLAFTTGLDTTFLKRDHFLVLSDGLLEQDWPAPAA